MHCIEDGFMVNGGGIEDGLRVNGGGIDDGFRVNGGGTVHSRYNVHPDSHEYAGLKFKVACVRFAEEI